ncbi:MAG: hypothetical protein QOK68_01870 [Nitrososphaeraceae archaeon]|nr:hypothetical protein [Nitrososphaeraceae archaeon]
MRIIKPLSVAMGTMILFSVLPMVIQTSMQSAYAVEYRYNKSFPKRD